VSRSNDTRDLRQRRTSRRGFLKATASGLGALAAAPTKVEAFDLESFFQKHFRQLSNEELEDLLRNLERRYSAKFGKEVSVAATGPIDGVVFGYGLDISRCIGCRRCVHACVEENNQSRDPEMQWIRVLEFERERVTRGINLEDGDPYYDREMAPAEGKVYIPISCQQCEDSPCTNVCPTGATWTEPDGIVVIDYDWCIGCRYCMASCPYGARHFNWAEPELPADEVNPNMHLLGNRPRAKGVVEKCSFCIQRVRDGRYPACLEACPVGARKFGNLLDPDSEIQYILRNKRVFRLKEDLNTQPNFWYYMD
jgi:Fe-S-cluster-containing dehydrogenase component